MRKFFLIGIIATILIAVPLTVYILTTQKTTTQSGAAPSTLLAFTIPSDPATVGTPLAIPITVDPAGGGSTPNQVSFVKVVIQYDGTKLQAASNYFVADQKLSTLEGPTNSCDSTTHACTISATLSTGADPNNSISSQATIATLNFNPLAATDTNTPTKLTFASGSQALSVNVSSDKPAENVLAISRLQPGAITIAAANVTPTTADNTTSGNTTGDTSSGGTTSSGSTGSTGTSGGSGAPISCSSFSADNTSSDTAPLTVLLTAVGGSTAGNVTKVSFNYGDGTVQDVTTGGGIGTNSVSVQSSHIYKTTGTFTATAVLTDDAGNTTTPSDCSQTITIGSASSASPTPTEVAQATAAPTIPATGPGNVILGVGAVGVVITAVGLLFAIGI